MRILWRKVRCRSERKKNNLLKTSFWQIVSFIDSLDKTPSLIFRFSAMKCLLSLILLNWIAKRIQKKTALSRWSRTIKRKIVCQDSRVLYQSRYFTVDNFILILFSTHFSITTNLSKWNISKSKSTGASQTTQSSNPSKVSFPSEIISDWLKHTLCAAEVSLSNDHHFEWRKMN